MSIDPLVCKCKFVRASEIEDAVENGAYTFKEVQEETECCTKCGSCRRIVENTIREALKNVAF